jgi:hypothetical protein
VTHLCVTDDAFIVTMAHSCGVGDAAGRRFLPNEPSEPLTPNGSCSGEWSWPVRGSSSGKLSTANDRTNPRAAEILMNPTYVAPNEPEPRRSCSVSEGRSVQGNAQRR